MCDTDGNYDAFLQVVVVRPSVCPRSVVKRFLYLFWTGALGVESWLFCVFYPRMKYVYMYLYAVQ